MLLKQHNLYESGSKQTMWNSSVMDKIRIFWLGRSMKMLTAAYGLSREEASRQIPSHWILMLGVVQFPNSKAESEHQLNGTSDVMEQGKVLNSSGTEKE